MFFGGLQKVPYTDRLYALVFKQIAAEGASSVSVYTVYNIAYAIDVKRLVEPKIRQQCTCIIFNGLFRNQFVINTSNINLKLSVA